MMKVMNLRSLNICSLSEERAKEIGTWKYPGDFSVYDMPDWNTVEREGWGIANEEKRKLEFHSVTSEEGELCGFFRLVEKGDQVMVGLGLKPSYCGMGYGLQLVNLIKKEANEKFGARKLVLEVRSFNKRAIKCYERAGFKKCGSRMMIRNQQDVEFIIMEYLSNACL